MKITDLNEAEESQNTLLCDAIVKGMSEVINWLLEQDAILAAINLDLLTSFMELINRIQVVL